ncbi:helix-turn-helix domain-containing protein [Haloplasma contractile]|uniref:Helix-turn-helix domain containing protein n=1 Tax=Haloplasma contractile SSD-17B TaxID=1033810 RepID=U2EAG9_9MOLU|nr:helix-turn-helix transcriptional regulator [Haloplasma contractile]ERJ11826.1 Helix-turn-helix domain containing protein [Haloplasma contractile SSD-17B]
MEYTLRDILKNVGITQKDIAEYLGISRQYLNSYLDETYEDPRMPEKFMLSLIFLFNCKTREEFYKEAYERNSKAIKKRLNTIKDTKSKVDMIFNIDNDKKLELFKIIDYLNSIMKMDAKLIEAFGLLIQNLSKNDNYKSLLTFLGKKHMLIEFDDNHFNEEELLSREALLFKALESESLDFNDYRALHQQFKQTVKNQTDIDINALKQSLRELGFNNLDDVELLELINKYETLKRKQ